MRCTNCNFENKEGAKFCTKCGQPLNSKPAIEQKSSGNSRNIIIALVAIIVILAAAVGFFALNSGTPDAQNNVVENDSSQDVGESGDDSQSESDSTNSVSKSESKTKTTKSKSWVSIGSYSGSGSGSQTIEVPAGKIKVELSAYPIKNYATNHLYVSGSNGESGGVDWGSKSAVETRSDSFTYTSSSSELFTIDYYETAEWNVEFFAYQ